MRKSILAGSVAAVALTGCGLMGDMMSRSRTSFDGNAALAYAKAQVDFGPRVPGTAAHDSAADWIEREMKRRTDSVTVQRWTQKTANGTALSLRNVLARFNPGASSRVLYVTHWDTRPHADNDPNLGNRALPILGANDAASGVGLFVALGDVFKKTPPSVGVDLLFVDGEDWGDFEPESGAHFPDALFGSQYFADHPPSPDYAPLYGVVFDMIGDSDLRFWQEGFSLRSAPEVVARVWRTAKDLGYGKIFRDEAMGGVTDDHLPLLRRGWHVMDLIDLQYGPISPTSGPSDLPKPDYHHSIQDTFDKISAKSLKIVGDVAVTLVK